MAWTSPAWAAAAPRRPGLEHVHCRRRRRCRRPASWLPAVPPCFHAGGCRRGRPRTRPWPIRRGPDSTSGRPGGRRVSRWRTCPGTWNFSDLPYAGPGRLPSASTRRPFGWEVDDLGFGMLVRRPGYGDHLEATVDPDIRKRQSQIAAPMGFEDAVAWIVTTGPDRPPHWHVTFTVADRDRTASDAERLGAEVPAPGRDPTGHARHSSGTRREPSSPPASSLPRVADGAGFPPTAPPARPPRRRPPHP